MLAKRRSRRQPEGASDCSNNSASSALCFVYQLLDVLLVHLKQF
jgi:hypothetical protein